MNSLLLAYLLLFGLIIFELISYKQLKKKFDATNTLLGYYILRYGEVSKEDYINLVGINKKDLENKNGK